MNQFEELREKCAKLCESLIDQSKTDIGKAMAQCCAENIRALPLPEVNQKPVAWICKNEMQKLIDKSHLLRGFGAVLLFNKTEVNTEPLYAITPDLEKLCKENKQLKALLQKHGLSIEGHDV